MPRRPEPRRGSAPPSPSSVISMVSVVVGHGDVDVGAGGVGVADDVGQGLGGEEVGGGLDGPRAAAVVVVLQADGQRGAADERAQRGDQTRAR